MTDSPALSGAAPMRPRVRSGPAIVVLAIVAIVIIGGSLLALLPNSAKARTDAVLAPRAVIVNGVRFVSVAGALARIDTGGAIPSDVSSSLYVPEGAVTTATENLDNGNGPFDRSLTVVVNVPAPVVVNRETILMGEYGWKLSASRGLRVSIGHGTVEVLAQHPGSDGYYWEAGISVVQSPLDPTGRANLTIRLLQVPDGN